MDFPSLSKARRSVREFLDTPISKSNLIKIIDAARFSPTARNIQPWEFVIIADKKILTAIANLAPNGPFIKHASVCIAVLCQDTKYYLEDGCAATVNILNAAVELGIGSCWVAGDKKPYCDQVLKLVNAPAGFKLVSLIALGFAATKPSLPEKRPLDSMLHWEKF